MACSLIVARFILSSFYVRDVPAVEALTYETHVNGLDRTVLALDGAAEAEVDLSSSMWLRLER